MDFASPQFLKPFLIELRDSVVFSVIQKDLKMFDLKCAYVSTHTFSHLNYIRTSSILPYPRLSFASFGCG